MRGSFTQIKFSKKKLASGKTLLFVSGPFFTFYISHSIFLNIGFRRVSFLGSVVFSIVVLSTKKH